MSYIVTIQPSGHQFEIEDDESILESALRQGFSLPYGCRNGGCGNCKGKILRGEIDYGPIKPRVLNVDDEQEGIAVFCQAYAIEDLEIEVKEIGVSKDIVVKTLPVRVAEMELLNHDVMELKLRLPATERLQFLPGQYIDILLKDGRRRGFSIANAPHRDEFIELQIRRVPEGYFTEKIFSSIIKPKSLLRIEGPLGSFYLREDSPNPILMIAGGTGFAPLQSMLEHLMIANTDHRSVHLFWGIRTREDFYRKNWLEDYRKNNLFFEYNPVFSREETIINPTDKLGYVHEAVLETYSDLSKFDIYISGPPEMIAAAKSVFPDFGADLSRFYSDSFEYAIDSKVS